MVFGNVASERQENIVANEGTIDRGFTVGFSSINIANIESTKNLKTLERCFNERVDKEMSNIVDTFEDRIQNATLTALITLLHLKLNEQSGQ